MYAYIVVALLTGACTEELRALTWDHVFLKGRPDLVPPQPPHITVWRSVRRSGDTKTRKCPAHARPAVTLYRCALAAVRGSGLGPVHRRRRVGGARARLFLGGRQAPRRRQRPPRLPPGAQGRRRGRRGRVDAPGAPAQLRVTALRPWRPPGGDLPARRSLSGDGRDRGGLPEADQAGDPDRRRRDGRHLRRGPTEAVGTQEAIVTQIDTHKVRGPSATYTLGPLTCCLAVGVAGFEPTTSSSRTKRAAKLRYTPMPTGLPATSITLAHRRPEAKSGFVRAGTTPPRWAGGGPRR